jgi:transposase
MRALAPEVVDAVWAAVEPLLPPADQSHPLGCHRPRIPDRICFQAMLIRLVTGCSWVDAERLVGGAVSDTTLRDRRDEWEQIGVFATLAEEALRAYEIIGLDLTETAVDGSEHKAPMGGEGTGPNPTDRGKSGWKWSLLTDRDGIPVGWATEQVGRYARSVNEIAIELGCDWHTVHDTVIAYGTALVDDDPGRFGTVTAFGHDEVLMVRVGPWHRQEFSTQIVDVGRGQLLDVVPGRSSAGPMAWLAEQGKEWRDQVSFATLDLSGPYRRVFTLMLPDAVQVADPFHGASEMSGVVCPERNVMTM